VVTLVLGLPEPVEPPVPPVVADPVFLKAFPDDVPVPDPLPLPADPPVPTASFCLSNFLSALFELVELEEPVPPEL